MFYAISAVRWIQFPVLLYCIFLELGGNGSDAVYRQLGLTKAEQAGLDLNFTSLLSGHHALLETSVFVKNWCFSFSGKIPITVMQLSQRNYGQCRLSNSVRLTTNLDGKQKDRQ